MKIYYWNAHKNFGDAIGSLLLKKFTKLDSEWSQPEDSDIVVCGSVIDKLSPNYKGVIAGAGILKDEHPVRFFHHAKILAVRGPLTSERLVQTTNHSRHKIVIADPGLLADELVGEQDKIYDLGIIPHWSDKSLEHNPLFLKYNPKIIRVSDDPLKVIKEIGQCRKIVSSSLHGIILADAFGIPRRIEIAPMVIERPKQEGGLFKWEDYSASLDMDLVIGKTQEVDRNVIIEKQHALFNVFEKVKSMFNESI